MAVINRLMLVSAIAACGLALLSEPAAAYWRRGWGPYPYGWGWYGWPQFYGGGPYGPGYYDPYTVYYVPPPPRPDPAYVRLWSKCPAGRIPARWIKKTDKQGQVIWVHQMGRCR
jgi:hypothetical protein